MPLRTGIGTCFRLGLARRGLLAGLGDRTRRVGGAPAVDPRAAAFGAAHCGPGQRAIPVRPQDQPTLLDADAMAERELGQVGHRDLHGAGDVQDRLVAVAEVVDDT